MKYFLTAASALVVSVSPLSAQPQTPVRAAAPVQEQNAMSGGLSVGLILAILALGIAIYAAADDEDAPDSP